MADLWQPFRDRPRSSGIFTDFDGTLADIVDDPAAARPLPGAPEVLARAAQRFAVVGVLSGRPLAFLDPLLPDPAVHLSGLYGLEQRVAGARVDHPSGGVWREVVADVVAAARHSAPEGMRLEAKGLSITLHYRGRPEIAGAVGVWAEAQAHRTGLTVRPARMSVELHPPIEADKGTALRSLATPGVDGSPVTPSRIDNVCFFGDDAGDLAAFDALDLLAVEGRHTVRVAVRSPESVADLIARADVVVDGPDGALALIRSLVDGRP